MYFEETKWSRSEPKRWVSQKSTSTVQESHKGKQEERRQVVSPAGSANWHLPAQRGEGCSLQPSGSLGSLIPHPHSRIPQAGVQDCSYDSARFLTPYSYLLPYKKTPSRGDRSASLSCMGGLEKGKQSQTMQMGFLQGRAVSFQQCKAFSG